MILTPKKRIKLLEEENQRLRDELNLEVTWAEGEIDFWKKECYNCEAHLIKLRWYEKALRKVFN